jgi:anti-sigma factor ChrR (cupin superfamily)
MQTGLRFLEVDPSAVSWRGTSSPGVEWCLLESEGAGQGPAAGATVLIRMAPGCGYPAHRHLDVEEVLILAGGYRDELGEHGAGEFLRYPAGSVHAPVALGDSRRSVGPDNPACLLFASARGGIEVLPEDRARG